MTDKYVPPTSFLQAIKEHSCPRCGGRGRLLVDAITDMPQLDHRGKRQYYCLWCGRIFAVAPTEKQVAGGIVHLPWAGPAPHYRVWTLGTFRLERRGRGSGQLW
jgi:DNA-directed RNA polymerase subunit RPC12/RpoP